MKKIFLISVILSSCSAFALDINSVAPVNPLNSNVQTYKKEVTIPSFDLKRATLSKNSLKNQYAIAMDKFIKSNVRASYDDFKILIDSVTPNDYVYMRLTQEMASIGFFSLAELSMSKIQDNDISASIEKDVKNFYFPSSSLNKKDQIYLGEMYSNIMYNDQSKEATSELIKRTSILVDSDYANYLVALGSMKTGNINQAKDYINKAISINSKNLNYKRLKAEILAQSDNPKSALGSLNDLESANMNTIVFDNEIHSAREYILYKIAKNEYLKKYHLAYYYYDKGELNKALGVLQTAISGKKNINKDVYALTARVYYDMQEYEKARDYAEKSIDIDNNEFLALIVIGDTYFRNEDYSNAQKYYKKAYSHDSHYLAAVKLAKTCQKQNDIQKAKDIYSKILKSSSKTYEAYYEMALLEKDREITYLKKALAINPDFVDGWIDLARIEINKDDFEKALSFLNIVKYIDDSNYRYYYYLGLVLKNKGLVAEANKNFQRSLDLKPDYSLAREELNI